MTMVASLGAAEAFTHNYLQQKENWSHVEKATILCSEVKFKKIRFMAGVCTHTLGTQMI